MKLTSTLSRMLVAENWLILLVLMLITVAMTARPLQLNQPTYSYQIAFDISQSMLVEDVNLHGEPLSRLELARQSARTLLSNLPCGSHIGWSVFTGRRTLTLLTPLDVCEHYAGLLAALNEISGTMRWSNGSIIGKGIHQLMRAADELGNDTSILFFSDGHEAPPMEQGQRGMPSTNKFDVNGLLIGVGGNTAVPIPKATTDGLGTEFWRADEVVQKSGSTAGEELSRRHDEHLFNLASLAQLKYHPLDSERAFMTAVTDKQFTQRRKSGYDYRWIPAGIALLLLFCRFTPSISDFRSKLYWKMIQT